VARLGAGCDTPIGAHAHEHRDGRLELRAFVGAADGSHWIRDSGLGDDPLALGEALAKRLLVVRRRGASVVAGRVAFVGAGPRDAGLLTARALELIAGADVILYDRLIPAEALAGARAGAELRYVGKGGRRPFVPQEETEALMLERARDGALVVRLKGGDPFVFGRGGEEALRWPPRDRLRGRARDHRRDRRRGTPGSR